MKNNLNKLVSVLETAKLNSIITWDFEPPYVGSINELRQDLSKILPSTLSVGVPFDCKTEVLDDGTFIIKHISIQLLCIQ